MVSRTDDFADEEVQARLTTALARQLGQIQLAGQMAKYGMAEIVQTHHSASELCAETLAVVDQILREAERTGRMTPLKQAALLHLRMAYVFEMLETVEQTGDQIIAVTQQ